MHLNIFVSQSCFLHCKGCYSFSREEEKGKMIPTDKLLNFLEFAYNVGVNKVTLCGGDPLTREDIIELLEKIKDIGFNISLDTVGSPIIKNVVNDRKITVKKIDAEKIVNLVDIIGIPIDGSTNEIFRRFRQTKDDIVNEQLEVCKELHKFGANICINTVAHKGNLEDAQGLANLIKKIDYINKWQIFQYMPLGKIGLKNRACFEITDRQFEEFQTVVLEVFDKKIDKVQFKDFNKRKNAYMLIDNSGNAWIPAIENLHLSKSSYDLNENTIIGNITNQEDWYRICSYLDNVQADKLQDILRKGTNMKNLGNNLMNVIFENRGYEKLQSI